MASRTELRLAALLRDLHVDAQRRAGAAAAAVRLGDAVDASAYAGFGFVIALLAVTAIPFVGMSTPFGLAIGFVGLQLIGGRPRPWLPGRVRGVSLSAAALDRMIRWTTRATGWMVRLVRPRLRWLHQGRARIAVGLGVLVHGLGLALPLPIPGSNLAFLIPILAYAIGLLEDDGALVALGHAATATYAVGLLALGHVLLGDLG